MNRTFTALTALALTAAAGHAAADDCINDGVCSESTSIGDDIGNNKFGADYSFGTIFENKAGIAALRAEIVDQLYALAATQAPPMDHVFEMQAQQMAQMDVMMLSMIPEDYLYVGAYGEANVTIFGKERSIIDADGDVRMRDGDISFDVDISVMGDSLSVDGLSAQDVDLITPIEMTFFDARTTYVVGFVPITVTGEVTGTVGILGSIDIDDKVELGVEPYAELTAGATVSVGGGCLRAGVGGEVLLVGAYAPSDLSIETRNCGQLGIEATYQSDLVLSTMDGRIYVFAELCVDDWDKTLVSWNGVTSEPYTILSGDFCF